MAWEQRRGRLFYYRCHRDPDGSVAREYLGRGLRATNAARAVAMSKAQRDKDQLALLDEQSRLAHADSMVAEITDMANLLSAAMLIASGYHRQNYGKWRVRRV
jgi:hypothetical protein